MSAPEDHFKPEDMPHHLGGGIPNEDFHEVWWIYSNDHPTFGGLRIAHFRKTVDGVLIFMISDEPPSRMGLRIWEDVSKRERWRKVEQIQIPKVPT